MVRESGCVTLVPNGEAFYRPKKIVIPPSLILLPQGGLILFGEDVLTTTSSQCMKNIFV